MSKVYLFSYGRLQPAYSPPATMTAHEPDTIRAKLFDREPHHDPLITGLNSDTSDVIKGTLLTIDNQEFRWLDEEETGYKRVKTTTGSGKEAYVYVWAGDLPATAKRIRKWPMES
jgi:gamma-glutamylcyclotransferase (GGCT)/AIG2-like uncharacterized protein YtfP